MATEQEFIATGRRKNAVARIRMTAGTGVIEINGRPLEEYFKTLPLQNTVLKPFEVAKLVNTFDVRVNAHGGGVNGQAGAVRLAVSRALIEQNPELLVEHAVKGMIPHNRLGRRVFTKLKVYAGPEHPHIAQQPQPVTEIK